MKNILYLFLITSLFSCRIEDKDAPSPDESFIRYYGQSDTSYEMVDIEVIYDSSDPTLVTNLILLGTRQKGDLRRDIYLVKTDAAGVFLADTAYSYDDDSDDVAKQLSRAGDNILVVGNTTSSLESGNLNGVIWNEFTLDLTPTTQPTESTLYSIFSNQKRISGNDLIQTSDGNFVMVGNYITLADDQQYYRMKIDAAQRGNISDPSNASNTDQALLWFESGGVSSSVVDDLVKAFEKESGDLVFIGNSTISSSFPFSGNGGTNVIFVPTNNLGKTQDRKSYGFTLDETFADANDVMSDAIEKTGGYVITGTSSFGNSAKTFFISVSSEGVIVAKNILTSSFEFNGQPLSNSGLGVTQGSKNDFVVVGQYPDFRGNLDGGETENKEAEAMFFRTNQIGEPLLGFETNYGLISGDDRAVVAKTLPNGKIVVGSTIDFGSGSTLMSLIKLNDTGELDN